MGEIVGRKREQAELARIFKARKAQFVAIYGRRRVGKTFLVRRFFAGEECAFFNITGIRNGALPAQLDQFTRVLEKTFYASGVALKTPASWMAAFELLTATLAREVPKNRRAVLFFDELPWLASKKSQFMQALDYFWNRYWSDDSRLRLIVCGSAASWMLDKLIDDKGGLHNRLTATMRLEPLTLREAKEFLRAQGVRLADPQILDLYMIIGGIPHYLEAVQKGRSVQQNVDRLCFTKGGLLFNEFHNLYSSLFLQPEAHEELLRLIASKRRGLAKTEIAKQAKLSSAGGRLNQRLRELEEAGFIASFKPYGFRSKGVYFRIIDEYTLFYLDWIEPVESSVKRGGSKDYWHEMSQTPRWKSWAGYAFEAVCFKHVEQIRYALEVPAGAGVGSWQYVPKSKTEDGVQIDLLFDRSDNTITICEIKYCISPYTIGKQEAVELQSKMERFARSTHTGKQVTLGLITSAPLKESMYSEELVEARATLDDLMS